MLLCVSVSCVAGCGIDLGNGSFGVPLILAECGGSSESLRTATDLVVLDWSGGTSVLYPYDDFDALDFTAFATTDGGTLADDVEAFKEAVRLETTGILCGIPEVGVRVETAPQAKRYYVSTVRFAQVLSQQGPGQIGQGEYDPCNLDHDNVAVVFGEELLGLGGPYTVDEWVLMFANVTAHEIGHMIGFGHVERWGGEGAERSRYVELMLAVHTVEEMVSEQRFLSDDTNCPADDSFGAFKRATEGDIVCGVAE